MFILLLCIFMLGIAATQQDSCALNRSTVCPLPPWKSTYNLSQSSIVYQPWCGNNDDPYLCLGLVDIPKWWAEPGNSDEGSWHPAHWGLISIDWATSVRMWAGSTFGGATPGNPLTFNAQAVMLADCALVKSSGWAERCFVYDNMVNSLGWYKSHRDKMLDPASWPLFNIMQNTNTSQGLQNLTGTPYMEVDGGLVPCWKQGLDRVEVCGPVADIRLPCFYRGDCNSTADGSGFGYYWNYSAPGAMEWRVADMLDFVRGDGVDGLFTDEIEMYPGDGGGGVVRIVGNTEDDVRAQQAAGQAVHQAMIDALVAEGKYLWHAFQAGNNIGSNTNNNTNGQGGQHFDAEYCTNWMVERCNSEWVNQRAITVQFDSFNVNVSIASFLIVRPAYAWIGYGAGYLRPKWNDAFLWDVGVPVSECRNGSTPGTFERDWTYGTATMDCNTYSASVPCNPADTSCGEPPRPPPPPPPSRNWAIHNCTSCQTPPAKPLAAEYTDLTLNQCLSLCQENPACRYVNWVEPAGNGECTLWGDCGEMCLTDHCWNWWVTYENLDRTRPLWNTTACDSLPEKPSF